MTWLTICFAFLIWQPMESFSHRNQTIFSEFRDKLDIETFGSHQLYYTTLQDFLYYVRHLKNLNGYRIRSTLGNNPPRALMWTDDEGNLQVSGYHLGSLKLFASYYNASLEYVLLSNLAYYTELECLKYLDGGKVDVCADAMPMRPEFIISATEEITHSYLVVPYDKPMGRFLYFVKPFQPQVWLLVLASCLFKMLTLSFIHRLQRKSWNWGHNFLISLQSLLTLPFDLDWLQSWHRGLIEMLFIVLGFVVANWYLSILSSLLFTRIYSEFITSLEDLETYNISIMISEFEHYTLNNSDIYARLKKLLMVVDQETLQSNRRNFNPAYAYYGQVDNNEFYLYQQKRLQRPRMKGLEHITLNPLCGGIPVRPYWPLQEKLARHMSHMFEGGMPVLQPSDTAQDAIKMGYLEYFSSEQNDVEPLSLDYFEMPAILLLSGYVMGLVSFLRELIINNIKN